jgi:hypothetical protein
LYTDYFIVLVIKDTLENKGTLAQIKAKIRAEVFNALNDESEDKPQLSNENLIINELIREYLDFNKYKYTSSVLVAGNDKVNFFESANRSCRNKLHIHIHIGVILFILRRCQPQMSE